MLQREVDVEQVHAQVRSVVQEALQPEQAMLGVWARCK